MVWLNRCCLYKRSLFSTKCMHDTFNDDYLCPHEVVIDSYVVWTSTITSCYSEFEWETNDPGAVSTFTDIAPSMRYSYDNIAMPHGRTALSISSIIIIIGIQFLFEMLFISSIGLNHVWWYSFVSEPRFHTVKTDPEMVVLSWTQTYWRDIHRRSMFYN